MIKLTAKAQQAFRDHVLAEFPKEACGLIVRGRYIKCQNMAADPTATFKIDPKVIIKYDGKIQAVLHSHPYDMKQPRTWDPAWPSTADMECWMQDDIPWGIVATCGEGVSDMVWLDDNDRAPIDGREFIHGIQDCYAIIRDWFKIERNIDLPNYARGIDWWNKGEDLYSANFEKAGFVVIDKKEATVGDCALFQVRSPVINHAAVITGPDEIVHHLFHRLSGTDSLRRWDKQIVKYVRYKGDKE